MIDERRAERVEDANALARETKGRVVVFEAIRRCDGKLVSPAEELVERGERRGEGLDAVAAERLDTRSETYLAERADEFEDVEVFVVAQWIAGVLLLGRVGSEIGELDRIDGSLAGQPHPEGL